MIYLDNAATGGKKPIQVINAVNNALVNLCANPGRSGHKGSINAAYAVYNARKKIAEFFNAEKDENVCFTLNCTHSLNCVLKGVTRRGDHIIVSSLEHNAVMRPLEEMKRTMGITYDVADVSFNNDDETVENFEKLINDRTRLIVCTNASNVLGVVLPVKRIGNLCRKYNILFAVDGAQSAGTLRIDMQDMNIDYLCLAPHKSLYAPMGLGVLIADKPIETTIMQGGTGTDSVNLKQPDYLPEQIESGTINLPAICGLSAGIDYINRIGIDNIYRNEMQLLMYLYDGLSKNDKIILYTDRPTINRNVPVISFNHKNYKSTQTASMLSDKGIAVRAGLHCAPSAHRIIGTLPDGTVRVSLGNYVTKNDINYLLKTLKLF